MLETDYLYPNDMIAQCEAARNLLVKENEDIDTLEKSILEFVNDEELISRKVDGAKAHFYDYYLLLEELKQANAGDIVAFNTLQSEIEANVYEDLCGDIIIPAQIEAHNNYLSEQAKADQYLDWANNNVLFITNMNLCLLFTSFSEYHRQRAKHWFDLSIEYKQKMLLYDTIEYKTAGLFPGNQEAIRTKIQTAIEELQTVYINGMFHVNAEAQWRPILSDEEKLIYENITFYVTGEQLKKMGWDESSVTDEMVENLNYVLDKYDIDTTEEIAHFLGQCMYETENGAKLTEDGDVEYFSQYTYDIKYRGSGYIHITFEYGYKAFATYLILEKYPQLIDEETFFRNPEHKGQDLIEEMYLRVVEKATAQNLDISEYIQIVDEGAEYLAENYAWISAGYVWYIKDINQLIADGEDSDAVSEKINNGDFDTYPLREEKYQQVYNVLNEEI